MPYQGVVFGILVGVALAVAAVFYVKSQGNSHVPHSNRPRYSSGPLPIDRIPSWELG
jgi:hypothetical protein